MKKKYIIISAVRNEEDYIRNTMESVINQTILPEKWVLVNDGSNDRTPQIIESYQNKYPWILKIDLNDRGYYLPGEGIVKAFYKGFDLIKDMDWDFIIKMDCDLSFETDYIEKLLNEFFLNPKLGIASGGIYNVISENKIIKEKGKEDHPWGAAIMYYKDCFNQIGGIQPTLGWELASVINAQIHGWSTKCFSNLVLHHYRLTGNRHGGLTKGRFRHGRNLYRFGYPLYYTFLKAFNRMLEKPYFIGSTAIIIGYIFASIKKESYIYDKNMRDHLKKRLKKIIIFNIGFHDKKKK